MSEPPEIAAVARAWVAKAEEDLLAAGQLLTSLGERCPFGIVCYHAQQAAEKYLEALLLRAGVHFPKIHDLLELVAILPTHLALPLDPRVLARLNAYAIEVRYPSVVDAPTRAVAEEALGAARQVRDAVLARLA